MNFNTEQQKCIDLRDKNILVSAAAGSGKTRVLVARVIKLLTEAEDTHLENMLIMTFTKAAANEMKDRIKQTLFDNIQDEKISNEIKDKLSIELGKIANSNISTIHSFCNKLISNYYSEIGLDPDLRLCADNEASLLLDDSIEEAMNELLRQDDFKLFFRRHDKFINNYNEIKAFISLINSMPFKKEYLNKVEEMIEHYEDKHIMEKAFKSISDELSEIENDVEVALCLTKDKDNNKNDDFYDLAENYLTQINGLIDLLKNNKYVEIFQYCKDNDMKIDLRKGAKKDDNINSIKEIIKSIKGKVTEVHDSILIGSILDDKAYDSIKNDLGCFLELTKKAIEIYSIKKEKAHLMDVDDLEQYAITILYGEDVNFDENGNPIPTVIADNLAKQFKHIFVDEYQDTNRKQEAILYALSSERLGITPNLFMVGDIKQSIYRFRQAEPDIFREKYKVYSENTNPNNEKIDLNFNYRSSKEVIDTVNTFFYKIMAKEENGEIVYDKNHELRYKGEDTNCVSSDDYKKYIKEINGKNLQTEIYILQKGNKNKEDISSNSKDPKVLEEKNTPVDNNNTDNIEAETKKSENNNEKNGKKKLKKDNDDKNSNDSNQDKIKVTALDEFAFIANRINELLKEGYKYKDICILSRSANTIAIPLTNVLAEFGIPAFADTKKGFIQLPEIQMTLNFLKVIDNPMQDIPLVAVLHSSVFNFSNDEMANIRANGGKGCFYKALENFYKKFKDKGSKNEDNEFKESAIYQKINKFFTTFKTLREKAKYYTVSEIIYELYGALDYYNVISISPTTIIKKANLDLLISKAKEYESTSFSGLFNFVRYIENIEKKDMDEGIASVFTENDDIVRIKTIHGSKGLEYPVVILMEINKKGPADSSSFVFNADAEMACEYRDLDKKIVVKNTLEKEYITKKKNKKENEELKRLLYVAMTRAKYKLICTGVWNEKGNDSLFNLIRHGLNLDDPIYDNIKGTPNYSFTLPKEAEPKYLVFKHIPYEEHNYKSLKDKYNSEIEKKLSQDNVDNSTKNIKDNTKELKKEIIQENIKETAQENTKSNTKVNTKDVNIETLKTVLKEAKDNENYVYHNELFSQTEPKTSVSKIKTDNKSSKIDGFTAKDNYLKNKNKNVNIYTSDYMETQSLDDSSDEEEYNDKCNSPDVKELTGASRGTAIHRFLELLDYTKIEEEKVKDFEYFKNFIDDEKKRMIEKPAQFLSNGLMTKEELDVIKEEEIFNLVNSEIGKGIIQASKSKQLFREKAFMKLFPYLTVHPEKTEEIQKLQEENNKENKNTNIPEIIVQGIIDMYYVNGNEIVLLDYKTDKKDDEKYYIDTYKVQLDLYADVLKSWYGVDKNILKFIYSLKMGKYIEV